MSPHAHFRLLDLAESILETETEEVVTVKAISSLFPDE